MPPENESSLKRALKEGQIAPYFQPIVDLKTGSLSGFETLARWLHPIRGILSPSEFIPTAEASGLIGELTEQVLVQAAGFAAHWPEEWMLSINVSALQFRDRRLPKRLFEACDLGGMPASRLIVELTETASLPNHEQVIAMFEDLRASGVRLSLDDFGTGYASLLYLQTLPLDELKIDRSFVQSITDHRNSRKIVASIIELAHSLGISIVAEGIEAQTQVDMLLDLGCGLGQGWLFGHPIPESQLAAMLANSKDARMPFSKHSARWNTEESIHQFEVYQDLRLAQLQAIYEGAPMGL